MSQAPLRDRQRFAKRRQDAPRNRAGGRNGNLLTYRGSYGQLRPVGRAGNPEPWMPSDKGPQHRIIPQNGVDRFGIGVEVEQPSAALDGCGEVAPVSEPELAVNVIGDGFEFNNGGTVWEPERPPVGLSAHLLEARHRSPAQELEQLRVIQGGPVGESQNHTSRSGG